MSRTGNHHHADGEVRRDDGPDGGDEDDVPGREARSRRRDVTAAQDGPGLAGARPLADGEVVGHLPADDSLDHQLQRHRQHHADGDGEVTVDERDRQAGGGADHEVAELHRQPEERVEPIRAAR